MNQAHAKWIVAVGSPLLAVACLAVDLSVPLGVAAGILYVGVVLLSLLHPAPWYPLAIAALATILTVAGAALSPPQGEWWIAVANRSLAIFAILGTATLGVRLRHATAGREQLEQRFSALVESTGDAIISKTLDGEITSWNAAATRLYGYTPAEAIGRPIEMLVPPDRAGEVERLLARIRRGERIEQYETVRITRRNQRLNISLTMSPIRGYDGTITGASVVARDITHHKTYEQALRKANGELEQANREMEEFVNGVSHDLKSPLVTIGGMLGLLREELDTCADDEVTELITTAERSVGKMRGTIGDVLELSRVGRVVYEMTEIAPHDLVDAAVARAQPELAAAGFTVERVVDLPTVHVDIDRLIQVFDNLILNAVHYARNSDPKVITIGGEADADEVRMFVRDHGPGIDPAFHARIFRPFERLDRTRDGTGIGLAIVKRITEAHGGRVWLESAPGAGATFWLGFPRTARRRAEEPRESGARPHAAQAVPNSAR